jgi:hypothetical protein
MRIQLEIPEERVKELRTWMEEGGLKTYNDLFTNALTLMKWAVKQVREGRAIISLDERTGKEKELAMPFLETVGARVPREVVALAPEPVLSHAGD